MALLTLDPATCRFPLYSEECRRLSDADPVMASLIKRIGVCHLRPRRDYFATLCDSVISQQLSPAAAATIYERFIRLYAARRPTPRAVARTRMARLRAVGLSPQKAAYVQHLALGFLKGTIRPRRFAHQDNDAIIETLSSIHGIGRWTAEMFLIFALNRLDVLPVGDLGIQKAVKRWYMLRHLPGPDKLRAVGRRWAPHETLACWYLWQSARLE